MSKDTREVSTALTLDPAVNSSAIVVYKGEQCDVSQTGKLTQDQVDFLYQQFAKFNLAAQPDPLADRVLSLGFTPDGSDPSAVSLEGGRGVVTLNDPANSLSAQFATLKITESPSDAHQTLLLKNGGVGDSLVAKSLDTEPPAPANTAEVHLTGSESDMSDVD